MVLAHQFSTRLDLAPAADGERLVRHLKEVGLPTRIADIPGGVGRDAESLVALMAQDKKVSRGKLTFILTRGIGKAFIAPDIQPADVTAFLTDHMAR
jgi:3-dehydroquinate synthase